MDLSGGGSQRGEPKLVFVRGPNQGRVEILKGERVTVGRNPSNEIVLDLGLAISSFHAAFLVNPQDGSWWIEDLRSKNGTFVNGDRIDRVQLHEGDVICFARRDLEIEFTTRDPGVPASGFLEPTVTEEESSATVGLPARAILDRRTRTLQGAIPPTRCQHPVPAPVLASGRSPCDRRRRRGGGPLRDLQEAL